MGPCSHKRTEFVYRRDGIDYLRCHDCDAVFDADDLETVAIYDGEEELGVPARHRR